MKFKLASAGIIYTNEQSDKLKKLGFEFRDGLSSSSKIEADLSIEINSIEELMELQEEYGKIIVEDDLITIYDDYVE